MENNNPVDQQAESESVCPTETMAEKEERTIDPSQTLPVIPVLPVLPAVKSRPVSLLTPRIASSDLDPNSPSVYPKIIMSFAKLFWQSGTNIKFELFRLAPTFFSQQVCLVATNLDTGEELERQYFDQMLLVLLLRPQMDISKNSNNDDSAPQLAKEPPHNILDNQSKMLKKFFENKIHIIEDGTIRVRGLASIDHPSPNVGCDQMKAKNALPKIRQKAMTFDHFESMHNAMKVNMESVRRNTATAKDGLAAAKTAMDAMSRFNSLMLSHQIRKQKESHWSIAKKRWKKAIRRVLMDAAVARTREHLHQLEL